MAITVVDELSALAAKVADAAMTTDALHRVLSDTFGFDSLRPGQAEVIDEVMTGRPVVTVMPTGAGKSLCYQLPAVLLGEQGGMALVVSPLIALMRDQVTVLRANGVAAAALTSASSQAEQLELLDEMRRGEYTIVYVAPERFRSPRFLDALAAVRDRISLLAVDEAHCISEWGHEFRPDYRQLKHAIADLKPPRLIALTATATPEVREDIAQQLDMVDPCIHVRGFNRANLHLSVKAVSGAAQKTATMVELVRTRNGGAGLVYAATRKNAEAYNAALIEAGMRSRVYHAGLADKDRHASQDAFMSDDLDVIVATNAFGMGVDKSNIRLVVHADLPRSAEAYYQEAGRAGRDGESARCVLLFNHSDVRLQHYLIDITYPTAEVLRTLWKNLRSNPGLGTDTDRLRESFDDKPSSGMVQSALQFLTKHGYIAWDSSVAIAVEPHQLGGSFPPMDVAALARRGDSERGKLHRMVDYAHHPGCRREFLLSYFGDPASREVADNCTSCDTCRGEGGTSELTEEQAEHVRVLLSILAQVSGRFGRGRIAGLARGDDDDWRLSELPERGALRGQSIRYLTDLLRSLESANLIERSRGEYPTLKITGEGERVAFGQSSTDGLRMFSSPSRSRKRAKPKRREVAIDDADLDPQMVERLRSMRMEFAQEMSRPAYHVFSNRTLDAIARDQPATLDALSEVPGIGPKKLDAYGEAILAAVRG